MKINNKQMIFNRTAEKYLKTWKLKSNRKPLVIRGARQVGKTTLIRKFSETYNHTVSLNLEKASDLAYFQIFDDTKPLLESIFLSRNIPISLIDKTLLFIDEIQESPKAIQMLRYMYEEFPELHVIAAGSLLEFAMKKVKSFPVGRVEYLYLYPLNFPEFLEATGHHEAFGQLAKTPLDTFAHQTLLDLFNQYAIIGGMPEIVNTYIEKKSITELPPVYESIWTTYKNDIEKYASNDTERKVIRHIMSTAHFYVDQRIRFQNFGQSNYRSREVGEAFRNLDDARVLQLIYPSTDTEIPVKPDLRKSPRLQFLDTGLINHELGIQKEMLAFGDLSNSYRGSIIPHLISQELVSLNTVNFRKPVFWVRDKKQSSAELDMIYSYHDKVIPVEVKSGSTGTLRSLHQFIERCDHPFAVRIFAGEFNVIKAITPGGKPYFLMNLPYYLGTRLPEYIDYFVVNHENLSKGSQ